MSEGLDKVGASMYGNESSPTAAPPGQTSIEARLRVSALTVAA